MEEIHHVHKLDKPSGTAISLAQQIISKHSHYEKWNMESVSENTITIDVKREEEVPGTHIIRYNSDVDSIEIGHYAKNRKGFALGAVMAAEFIHDKKGVFGMKDLLNFN
jgi:4-hydroxy-tetrahydrodipicolinate reductase